MHAAPEPSSILWQNLEVRGLDRLLRQTLSVTIAVLCIFVSITVIAWGKAARDAALSPKHAPNLQLCPTGNATGGAAIPHLASGYFGAYEGAAGSVVRAPYLDPSRTGAGEDRGAGRLDGLSAGAGMSFDEMCNPSSLQVYPNPNPGPKPKPKPKPKPSPSPSPSRSPSPNPSPSPNASPNYKPKP